jgi:hypothetical protein
MVCVHKEANCWHLTMLTADMTCTTDYGRGKCQTRPLLREGRPTSTKPLLPDSNIYLVLVPRRGTTPRLTWLADWSCCNVPLTLTWLCLKGLILGSNCIRVLSLSSLFYVISVCYHFFLSGRSCSPQLIILKHPFGWETKLESRIKQNIQFYHYFIYISSRDRMTIDRIMIGNWIYWILTYNL